jgi:hypothetical protein
MDMLDQNSPAPNPTASFTAAKFFLAVFLAGMVLLEGILLNVTRPFTWPYQGEIVNGMFLSCQFSMSPTIIIERCFYPLLFLFFVGIDYQILKRLIKAPSVKYQCIMIAGTCMAMGFLASIQYGGTVIHVEGYPKEYKWKWLGVDLQEETMADCN